MRSVYKLESACSLSDGYRTRPTRTPCRELGFMYSRDVTNPDGRLWGAVWMDPAAVPAYGDKQG